MQYTGVLGMGVMSVAMLLAVRPAWLEHRLHGLDKMYRLHKWLGISGLVLAVLHWLCAQGPKWLVQAGLLTAALIPIAISQNIAVLVVVTILSGSIVAPTLISVFTLTERLMPPASLTEGLAWAVSGLTVGFAVGSALAGQVVDVAGTGLGYALPAVFAAVATITILVGGRYLGQRLATHSPGGSSAPAPLELHDPALPDPLPGPGPTFQRLEDPRGE